MTLSIRYRVEYGNTSPETRLMAINKRPTASSPRRGRIRSQTIGSTTPSLGRALRVSEGFEEKLTSDLHSPPTERASFCNLEPTPPRPKLSPIVCHQEKSLTPFARSPLPPL